MRRAIALIALLLPFLLTSCSTSEWLEGKGIQYKSASKLPPLEVPPDLTRPGKDDRYAVPDVNPSGTATYSSYNADRSTQPRSGASDVLPNVDKVRIQRNGDERWLVVAESPEQVWPLVKQFWMENGFLLKVEMPEVGIMETDWAENRAKLPQDPIRATLGKILDQLWSTGERDKFRTRLERSPDGKSTEIYISHRGMVEKVAGDSGQTTLWEPRPADPELEAEFLRRLMVRMGVQEDRAKTLVAASPMPQRAKLTRSSNGLSVLAVDEPFDRAWRRVGLALDRVGFTVEDRDRSKGLYYVRYVDPKADTKKDEGWLSKLKFWGNSDQPNKAVQYRVQVRETEGSSQVQVLAKDNQPDNSEISRKILALLQDQLK